MLSGKVSTCVGRTLIKISTSGMLRYVSIMLSRKTVHVSIACLKHVISQDVISHFWADNRFLVIRQCYSISDSLSEIWHFLHWRDIACRYLLNFRHDFKDLSVIDSHSREAKKTVRILKLQYNFIYLRAGRYHCDTSSRIFIKTLSLS